MSPQPTGLRRDLNLVRRRAWLFAPFFLLGIVVAYAFGSVAGDANASATLTLDTVIQDLVAGGDRGLRIFEAESMTGDDRFKKKVIDRIGEDDFDYGRFSISLSPISVADGVSRGVITVSITDAQKADAERYRDAFVAVFTEEYTAPEGLFRTRFVEKKLEVATNAEKIFEDAYTSAEPLARSAGIPIDDMIRPPFMSQMSVLDQLSVEEGRLYGLRFEAEAAGDTARAQQLSAQIAALQGQRHKFSDGGMSPELREAVGTLRGANEARHSAYVRLANARDAVNSAQSDIESSLSVSGGLAGSTPGRVAVVMAVTLVFGLIAIYAWEWLSQIRTGMSADRKVETPRSASS